MDISERSYPKERVGKVSSRRERFLTEREGRPQKKIINPAKESFRRRQSRLQGENSLHQQAKAPMRRKASSRGEECPVQ